ncbi:MAG: SDR family oxidoreductase [Planctomycetota bacterium]
MDDPIVIIGGSHGIGFELVKRLAARGAQILNVSRTLGDLEASGLLDQSVQHFEADVVTSDFPINPLPEKIGGFVYCPGSIRLGPVNSVKADRMREEFELNVVAATNYFQACLPALKASGHGSAVFYSTVAVNHGITMHSYVAAAKGALQALAKTWAAELAPTVRVNCVAPALTDTPLAKAFLSSDAKRQAMSEKYPLGRVGSAADIAAMTEFLLSSESGWITGQTLGVDGGMSGIVRV